MEYSNGAQRDRGGVLDDGQIDDDAQAEKGGGGSGRGNDNEGKVTMMHKRGEGGGKERIK